jgi:PTS system fructose-specific IIC component
MATPLGFTAAYFFGKLFKKNIYTKVEVETIKTAFPMGIFEIVEGVLPIVLNDIVRCVVATGIGGAVGGAISMYFSANSKVPFGGLLAIPTMTKPLGFIIGLVANVAVTGIALAVLKKRVTAEDEQKEDTAEEADLNMDDIQIS